MYFIISKKYKKTLLIKNLNNESKILQSKRGRFY